MKKIILIIFISINSILVAFGQCSVTSQIQQGDCNATCQGIANAVGTGISPLSYFWSNGDITQSSDSLCSDSTYIVTLIDSIGCMASDTVFVPPAFAPLTHLTANASCSSCCDGTDTLIGIPSYPYPCNYQTYEWITGTSYFIDTVPYMSNLCALTTYTVIVSNGCGCSIFSTVNIGSNTSTSVIDNESTLLNGIIIYPNPSNGEINMEWKESEKKDMLIELTNFTGKIVFSEKLKSSNGIKNLELNICNGIYFVHLTNLHTNENIVKRIVIQK